MTAKKKNTKMAGIFFRGGRLFFNCYLLLLLNSTFLLVMKGVSEKKRQKFFRPWHGIDLRSFASRAIALPLSHGDIGG